MTQVFDISFYNIDYNEFECREIRFKTPSEHTINGQTFFMEIQILCWPLTQQAFREKLILALLVENKPGGMNEFMKNIDVLNLPNKLNPKKSVSESSVEMNL